MGKSVKKRIANKVGFILVLTIFALFPILYVGKVLFQCSAGMYQPRSCSARLVYDETIKEFKVDQKGLVEAMCCW